MNKARRPHETPRVAGGEKEPAKKYKKSLKVKDPDLMNVSIDWQFLRF